MSFERPTLSDLTTRIRADFQSRLVVTGSLLRRSMVEVISMVWGGSVHLLHGNLAWLAKQLFADQSERDFLVRNAAQYGVFPHPAEFAEGVVLCTGTEDTVIEEGKILVSTDGVTYGVTTETPISGGEADVPIKALLAGESGNLEEDTELTFDSPIDGVNVTATVEGPDGLAGGADEEDTEDFRIRFLEYLRDPPQGGNDADYVRWAKEVAEVTRVWVYRFENGLGTVVVRFVMDDREDPIPLSGDVDNVQAAIDAERPTTAEVTVVAPSALDTPFDITVTPNTAEVKAAVEAELVDLFRRDAEAGDGSGRGTVLYSQMLISIGVAAGVTDFTLNSPSADVVPATGELPTLGDITWS